MLGKSLEDYLEAIYLLHREKGGVHSVDVANYLNFSKPSVCLAVRKLQENGCLTVDEEHLLHLTGYGEGLAEDLNERRCFFASQFIQLGVSPEIARQDACRMEHMISDESFAALKQAYQNEGDNE